MPLTTDPKSPVKANRNNRPAIMVKLIAAAATLALAGIAYVTTVRVASNKAWTPVEQDFGGVTMVQVPVGCFKMGRADGIVTQKPVHDVCITKPFWLDKTEVTNKQYGTPGTYWGDNQPRESITWSAANAFCAKRGGRLPTEAEWEYAARGPDNLTYPWGNSSNVWEFAVDDTNQTDGYQTANVGSKPNGKSWVGALDMSGNVYEWVNDWYDAAYYKNSPKNDPQGPPSGQSRVIRGGRWVYKRQYNNWTLRAADRSSALPVSYYVDLGFRCARSS